MPNGSPATIPDDMRPPTLPVYEGCWYHGSEDGAGAAIPHGVIPHTIRANLFSSSQIENGFLIQCHADGVEKTFEPPAWLSCGPTFPTYTRYI
jgi:hypothetical protein